MNYENLLFRESKQHAEEVFKKPPSFGKGVWTGKENQAPDHYFMDVVVSQQ